MKKIYQKTRFILLSFVILLTLSQMCNFVSMGEALSDQEIDLTYSDMKMTQTNLLANIDTDIELNNNAYNDENLNTFSIIESKFQRTFIDVSFIYKNNFRFYFDPESNERTKISLLFLPYYSDSFDSSDSGGDDKVTIKMSLNFYYKLGIEYDEMWYDETDSINIVHFETSKKECKYELDLQDFGNPSWGTGVSGNLDYVNDMMLLEAEFDGNYFLNQLPSYGNIDYQLLYFEFSQEMICEELDNGDSEAKLLIYELDYYSNRAPVIGNPPSDINLSYEQTSSPSTPITWNVYDDFCTNDVLSYKIEKNGVSNSNWLTVPSTKSNNLQQITCNTGILPAGTHTFKLTLSDGTGKTATDTVTVYVENDAPEIIVNTPEPIGVQYGCSGNTFSFSVDDVYSASRTYEFYYYESGVKTVKQSGNYNNGEPVAINLDFLNSNYNLDITNCYLKVFDGVSTVTKELGIKTIDTTNPNLEIQTDFTNAFSGSIPSVVVSASDIHSIDKVEMTIYNDVAQDTFILDPVLNGDNLYYLPSDKESLDGTEWGTLYENLLDDIYVGYTLDFTATDISGNSITMSTALLKDSTKPEITINSYDEFSYWLNAPKIDTFVGDDSEIAVFQVSFESDPTKVFNFEQDESDDHIYTLNSTNQDWNYYQGNWSLFDDGSVTLVYYCEDIAGNFIEFEETINKDTVPPPITTTTELEHFINDMPDVEGYVSDDVGIMVYYRYNLNGEWRDAQYDTTDRTFVVKTSNDMWNSLDDGENTLYIRAEDEAGNNFVYATSFIKDTTDPLVNIIINSIEGENENEFYEQPPSYEISVNEENLDYIRVYAKDIENFLPYDINLPSNPETIFTESFEFDEQFWNDLPYGESVIEFEAVDKAGNIAEICVTLNKLDSSPIIEFTGIPDDGDEEYFVYGEIAPTYDLSITGDLAEIDPYWYEINGVPKEITELSDEIADWDTLNDGVISITFFAKSIYGRISETTQTIYKDTTAPVITIISPVANEEIHEIAPMFQLNVEDLQEYTLWYSLDGGGSEYPATSAMASIDQIAWDNAYAENVTIIFYARDASGYTSEANVTVYRTDFLTHGTGIDASVFLDMPWQILIMFVGIIGATFGVFVGIKRSKGREVEPSKALQNALGISGFSGLIVAYLTLTNTGILSMLDDYSWLEYTANQLVFIGLVGIGLGIILYELWAGIRKPEDIKSDLTEFVSDSSGLTTKQTERVVDQFVDDTKDKLKDLANVNFAVSETDGLLRFPTPQEIYAGMKASLPISHSHVNAVSSDENADEVAVKVAVIKGTPATENLYISADKYLKTKRILSFVFLGGMVVLYFVLKYGGFMQY